MLRLAFIPAKWKFAHVIMIKKKGKPSKDINSYRPISLLSLLSKVLERLILPKLKDLLEPLLPNDQYGFRSQHSCPQQLHRVVDELLTTYESKSVCLGLFLDIEKAFDRVWHHGLLAKLKSYLPDTYYRIIQSYLLERTYAVKYCSATSKPYPIRAGVPQGSILGPLLYIFYTHVSPRSPLVLTAHFADDQAVLVRRDTGEQAHTILQHYTNTLNQWTNRWKIRINPTKTVLVCFTYKTRVTVPDLTLNGQVVPKKNQFAT